MKACNFVDMYVIIIIINLKSYIAHVSTNKVLKALSKYIYTEKEVVESYEF